MKALYYQQHGELDVVEYGDVPEALALAGQVKIKVKSVALNHLDIWVRRGWPGLNLTFPHIGGSDIVGEVVAVADSNSKLILGQRICVYPGVNAAEDEWTQKGQAVLSPHFKIIGEHFDGGLAEYVAVPTSNIFPAPENVSDDALAASLLVGLTSWRMLFTHAQVTAGQKILVVGSGGGVNSYTCLLAKAKGLKVYCLAGGAEKFERAQKLGIDFVIDYQNTPDWHREILKLTNGRGVDIVIDNVGARTFNKSLKALCHGGKLITVGNTCGYDVTIDNRLIFSKQLSIIGSTMGSRQDFTELLEFISTTGITAPIDSISPLADGIAQIQRLEKGEQFGKIILRP